MEAPRVRPSGRGVVVDPTGSVLLVQARAGDAGFWFTPGGGVEPGEDPVAATVREIAEETGIVLETLGPVILRRRARLEFLSERIEVDETFYGIQLHERPITAHRRLEPYEMAMFVGLAWLTAAEMRGQPYRIYPLCLPDLVDSFVAGEVGEPWEERDLHDDPSRVEIIRRTGP